MRTKRMLLSVLYCWSWFMLTSEEAQLPQYEQLDHRQIHIESSQSNQSGQSEDSKESMQELVEFHHAQSQRQRKRVCIAYAAAVTTVLGAISTVIYSFKQCDSVNN